MQVPICIPPMGESKQYGGSPLSPNGRYSLSKDTFIEKNYSTLISGI